MSRKSPKSYRQGWKHLPPQFPPEESAKSNSSCSAEHFASSVDATYKMFSIAAECVIILRRSKSDGLRFQAGANKDPRASADPAGKWK